jgi:Helix-turn-helix of DDE superfamily endonuclease
MQTNNLNDEQFRRQTGIKRKTFNKIFEILTKKELEKNNLGARPNKLDLKTRIIMWLEYLREYRTYFHIGNSYGISEATCYRNCVWIENTLIKSKIFSLKSKQFLLDKSIESVTVDVTESQIERPKKTRKAIILERKSVIT